MHANKTLIFTHDFTSSPQGRRGLHGFCVVFFWGGGKGSIFSTNSIGKIGSPPSTTFLIKKFSGE
jgi:hypothetical protein